jgi:hypothetical protein
VREPPGRVKWLIPEQRALLLAHANPRLKFYILATRYTRARRGNLAALRVPEAVLASCRLTRVGNGGQPTPRTSVCLSCLEKSTHGNSDYHARLHDGALPSRPPIISRHTS